ncbi:hypothetical protein HK405_001532, partial [Cladochytrium tenue]
MDMTTLQADLEAGRLPRIADFEAAANLIFQNAIVYNPPTTQVHQDALRMKDFFRAELDKALGRVRPKAGPRKVGDGTPSKVTRLPPPPPQASSKSVSASASPAPDGGAGMPAALAKKCRKLLSTLKSYRESGWFLEPVDPVALGIPTYFDVIKRPMDLATLQRRLEAQAFATPAEFLDDARLIFRNATTFNPPELVVHQDAVRMLGRLEAEAARLGLAGPASAAGAGTPAATGATLAAVHGGPAPAPRTPVRPPPSDGGGSGPYAHLTAGPELQAVLNSLLSKLRAHPDAL